MAKILQTVVLIVALCLEKNVNGRVVVDPTNGGYKGLIVAISPDIPLEEGKHLIKGIEKLFNETSKALCKATNRLARFLEVNIMLPKSWEDNTIANELREDLFYESASFNVVNDEGFSKKIEPRTVQFGSCGVQGHSIFIPKKMVANNVNGISRKNVLDLVRQWAHYRYGVFDEHGYSDDPVYPTYLELAGTRKLPYLNSCTNSQLVVESKTEFGGACTPEINPSTGFPKDEACILSPKTGNNSHITSSIMFSTDLEAVSLFCGTLPNNFHNETAKTKHNAMCNRKSVMEIIEMSPDFHGSVVQRPPCEGNRVKFAYVKERQLHTAFFMDASKAMVNMDFYETIKIPFKTFIAKDIPLDTHAYMVVFDENIENEKSLKPVILSSTESKGQFFNKWPQTLTDQAQSNILNALTKFFETVKTQTRVLAFTSTDALNEENATELGSFLKKTDQCQLHLVLVRHDDSQPPPIGLEDAVTLSGGRMYELNPKVLFIQMHDHINSLLRTFLGIESPFIDVTRRWTHISDGKHYSLPFTISEDPHMVESLSVCLIQHKLSNKKGIALKDVKLTIGKEIIDENSPLINNAFLSIADEHGNLYISYCFKCTNDKIADATLSFPTNEAQVPFLVTTTLKLKKEALQGKLLKLSAWAKVVVKKEITKNVVIIYAQLRRGVKPIKGANVVATITHPNANGDDANVLKTLQLYDNGLGDPDITEGDGIYSRYFTGFTQKGGYTVEIFADDNNNKTLVLDDKGTEWQSELPFTRVLAVAASFQVSWDIPKEDVYPPNRILDFRVVDVKSNRSTFMWTAPGDDYDGKRNTEIPQAAKYEIKYFKEYEDPEERFDETGVVVTIWKMHGPAAVPSVVYTVETLYAQLQENDTTGRLFFAIRTKDSANNVSPASNVVPVYLVHGSETSPLTSPATVGTETFPLTSPATVGIIIGSSFGAILLVILIVGLILLVLRRRRKSKSSQDSDSFDQGNTVQKVFSIPPVSSAPQCISQDPMYTANSWPADTLLKHYDKVQEEKQRNNRREMYTVDDLLENLSETSSMSNYPQNGYNNSLPHNNYGRHPKQITQV